MNSRWFIFPLTAFAVTLAVITGIKLNGEALALLIGVGIGVLASLPGYAVLFRMVVPKPPHLPGGLIPPAPLARVDTASPLLPNPVHTPRHFTVIGVDSIDSESNPFAAVD